MKSPVPNGVSTPATRPALLPNDRARRRLGVLPAVIVTALLVVGLVAACSGSTGTPTTAPTTPPTTASAASSAAATTATPAPPPSDQLQTALTKLKYRCSTELTDPVVQTKCFYADATTFFTVEWQGAAPAVRGFEVTGSALPASKLARSTATALASALGWSSADTKSASASLAKAQQKASRTDKLKLGWGTVVIFAEAYGNNGGHRLTITGTSKADKPVKVKGAMFPGSAKAVAAALKQAGLKCTTTPYDKHTGQLTCSDGDQEVDLSLFDGKIALVDAYLRSRQTAAMDAALKAALGSDAAAVTKAVSQAVAAGRYDIVTVSGWVVQVQPFPVKHGDRAFDVTVSAPSWS